MPLSLVEAMTSGTDDYSLLVEMREAKEKAFALYQGFKLDTTAHSVLDVAYFEDWSSAGDSLTQASNLTPGCTDIDASSYSAGMSCHFVNLFG